MKQTLLTVTVLLAAGAAACTKNETSGPSASTTTTSAATTTTSTSTTTTTAPTSFTLTGQITDAKNNTPLSFADFQVYSGNANVDRRWQSDSSGNYSQVLNPGSFVLRGWHAGYEIRDIAVNLNSNQRVDFALTPATTTTTVPAGPQASFSFSPNPCTIDPGGATNCTGTNTSTGDVASIEWLWAGKRVTNQNTVNLTFGCGDLLGSGGTRTLSVRLNATGTDGTISTVDSGVPVQVNGAACP